MSELLRMEHISKRFGNFYANQDINFSVAKGEVHTLLGENGAGKSTLMNILIGLYQPTEGKIFLNGQEVRIESPSQAVKLGIGMVHQHFMLVEAMTVFDNIILGDKHAKGLFIDRAARRKEIEALSEKYGLDVQLDKLITEISVGEQQRTEILKALYHGAELLILDEPSAALTDIEVEGLFAIMQKLVGEGKSIIFISHKMREVLRISDRITILRLGKVVGTVQLKGDRVAVFDPNGFIEHGVSHVPEDRNLQGLIGDMSIAENLVLKDTDDPRFSHGHGLRLNKRAIHAYAQSMMEKYDVRATSDSQSVRELSGGNQQKVIIARELESGPSVLVMAHPTRGLDIGATSFVHDQMIAARARGVGILLISADFDEILEMSDRIVVCFEGRIMGEFSGSKPPINEISLAMTGK